MHTAFRYVLVAVGVAVMAVTGSGVTSAAAITPDTRFQVARVEPASGEVVGWRRLHHCREVTSLPLPAPSRPVHDQYPMAIPGAVLLVRANKDDTTSVLGYAL